MYCKKCGAKLKEGQKFCTKCGTQVGQKQTDHTNQNSQTAGYEASPKQAQNVAQNEGTATQTKVKTNRTFIIIAISVILVIAIIIVILVTTVRGAQGTAGVTVTVSDTGKLIYSDDEGLAVYYTGAEARSEGGKYLYKIVLEAKNQTGKDVVIIPTSISLDGEDVEADLIDYSNGSITFYTNSYRTEGATVQFDLTIEYKQDGDTVIDEDAAHVTINVKEDDVEDTEAEEKEKKKKEEEDLIMSGDDILFY